MDINRSIVPSSVVDRGMGLFFIILSFLKVLKTASKLWMHVRGKMSIVFQVRGSSEPITGLSYRVHRL